MGAVKEMVLATLNFVSGYLWQVKWRKANWRRERIANMKDKAISEAIYNALIQNNMQYYKHHLLNQEIGDTGTTYDAVRKIVQPLDGPQKNAIIGLIKTVMLDTASTLLGAIDGTTLLAGADGDYTLLYEGEAVQGSLQDYFLAQAEWDAAMLAENKE